MGHRILCRTKFDITNTGVRRSLKSTHLPFVDNSGRTIDSPEAWNLARNQQRNWETINQIISLRALTEIVSNPEKDHDGCWKFLFEVDNIASVTWGADPVGALRFDSTDVPMIAVLAESTVKTVLLNAYGNDANIWFSIENGK